MQPSRRDLFFIMSANPATELASAVQSASIKRHPSPHHDINPSTAASKKVPADVVSPDLSDVEDDDDDTIPSDILRPRPRQKSFPPLPDFRFEQSYLASIKNAKTNTQVILITVRDQVFLPLAQGVLWNMAMFGWRYWNRGSKFSGQTLGARVRKWWWDVNNWKLPEEATKGGRGRAEFARGAEDVSIMSRWKRDVKRWSG